MLSRLEMVVYQNQYSSQKRIGFRPMAAMHRYKYVYTKIKCKRTTVGNAILYFIQKTVKPILLLFWYVNWYNDKHWPK